MARKNVNLEQRRIMLQYMEENESLFQNKFDCSDSEKKKAEHWTILTERLNSVGGGAIKPMKKWQKSWSDWKSDVKIKAGKIRQHNRGTGGGEAIPPLTELEEKLVFLIGDDAIDGLDVVDPLSEEVTESRPSTSSTEWENVSIVNQPDGSSIITMQPKQEATPKRQKLEENEALSACSASARSATPKQEASKRKFGGTAIEFCADTDSNVSRALQASVDSANACKSLAKSMERIALALETVAKSTVKIEEMMRESVQS